MVRHAVGGTIAVRQAPSGWLSGIPAKSGDHAGQQRDQPQHGSGHVTSRRYPGLCSRETAAHKLAALHPRRRSEFDWHLPPEAIDAAIRLDISNSSQIAAELGVTPRPID